MILSQGNVASKRLLHWLGFKEDKKDIFLSSARIWSTSFLYMLDFVPGECAYTSMFVRVCACPCTPKSLK